MEVLVHWSWPFGHFKSLLTDLFCSLLRVWWLLDYRCKRVIDSIMHNTFRLTARYVLLRRSKGSPRWLQHHMISCWSKWRPWRWRTPTWDKSSRTTRTTSPSWRPRPRTWRCVRAVGSIYTQGCLESKTLKEWIAAIITVIKTPSSEFNLNPRSRMSLCYSWLL